MRTFVALALLLSAVVAAHAQVCNPVCAGQPAQCCTGPFPPPPIFAEECTGVTSDLVHFVITNGTAWIDLRQPATFDVSGLSGSITLGDVMPVVVPFTIGTSSSSARFQVVDDSLPITVLGQCVGVSGVTYTGLPKMVSAAGRALQVLKQGTLFCRATGFPDILCLQVRGQVGPPFQAQQLCAPDRVEYICSDVS